MAIGIKKIAVQMRSLNCTRNRDNQYPQPRPNLPTFVGLVQLAGKFHPEHYSIEEKRYVKKNDTTMINLRRRPLCFTTNDAFSSCGIAAKGEQSYETRLFHWTFGHGARLTCRTSAALGSESQCFSTVWLSPYGDSL
jgi:hypothetical protein